MKFDLTQNEIRRRLDYDPDTGCFIWRDRPDVRPQWRSRHVGKRAGGVNSVTGYYEIRIDDVGYYGHRLAWIYMNGDIPIGLQIDHKNRNRSDNRADNLRLTTPSLNTANRSVPVRCYPRGVWFDGHSFEAYIGVNGQHVRLGRFATEAEAASARNAAAKKFHGEVFV